MASIHPALRFHYYRDDGEGGLEVVVTTADGRQQQKQLTDTEIARHVEQLAQHMARRYREKFGEKT